VARDAGLSERKKVTALRLAALPAPKFEALLEGDSSPTVTQLAEPGRHARGAQPPGSWRPDGDRIACARDVFRRVQDFCDQNKTSEVARECTDQDGEAMRGFVAALLRWP